MLYKVVYYLDDYHLLYITVYHSKYYIKQSTTFKSLLFSQFPPTL